MLWKYFQNCMYSFRENWETIITIWHTVPCFTPKLFTVEIKSTSLMLFWNYVADCSGLRGMVSICLIRKGKYNWFLHEELLLDWLIFLLFLLQFVRCSKYSAKTTILNLFLRFLHPFGPKHLRMFITVIRSKFHCLNVCHDVKLEEKFNNFVTWHSLVCHVTWFSIAYMV